MKKNLKTALIVLGAIALAGGAYYMLSGKKRKSSAKWSADGDEEVQEETSFEENPSEITEETPVETTEEAPMEDQTTYSEDYSDPGYSPEPVSESTYSPAPSVAPTPAPVSAPAPVSEYQEAPVETPTENLKTGEWKPKKKKGLGKLFGKKKRKKAAKAQAQAQASTPAPSAPANNWAAPKKAASSKPKRKKVLGLRIGKRKRR